MPDTNPPFVRVVVINFDGGPVTLRCLDALLASDYPSDRLEVVVVDNGSSDDSSDDSGSTGGGGGGYSGGGSSSARAAIAVSNLVTAISKSSTRTVSARPTTYLRSVFVRRA